MKTISNINKQHVNISVSSISSGLYFIEISDSNQNISTKKLIID
ncbi:T9SS type A sorting domain-containing protein [Bizionia hallyeonensis]|uniref:T9SS type A sorting domain-containing protein n=1 Tax=Bizionia hallyeonensis TaxID=1123757 RepID=A0ABW0C8H7_9FLAO